MVLFRSPFLRDILRIAILVLVVGFAFASYAIGYQEAAKAFFEQFLSFCRDLEAIIAPVLAALTGLFLFFLVLYGVMDIMYRSGLPDDVPPPARSHYLQLVGITAFTFLASIAKMIQENPSPEKLSMESILAALKLFWSYVVQGFRAELWLWIWIILFWLLILRLAHFVLLVVIIVIRGCFRSCGLCRASQDREADEEEGSVAANKARRDGSREHSPLPVITEEFEPPPTPNPYLPNKLAP